MILASSLFWQPSEFSRSLVSANMDVTVLSVAFPVQGHEVAVRHLVEAVQETRKKEAELLQKAKSRQQKQGDDQGQGQE